MTSLPNVPSCSTTVGARWWVTHTQGLDGETGKSRREPHAQGTTLASEWPRCGKHCGRNTHTAHNHTKSTHTHHQEGQSTHPPFKEYKNKGRQEEKKHGRRKKRQNMRMKQKSGKTLSSAFHGMETLCQSTMTTPTCTTVTVL